jgi:hypothetical protein
MLGSLGLVDYLGWIATGVFIASYFCKSPAGLRSFQMAGATLWIAYGVLISASPVIVANILVFTAAAWTTVRARHSQVLTRPAGAPAAEEHAHNDMAKTASRALR